MYHLANRNSALRRPTLDVAGGPTKRPCLWTCVWGVDRCGQLCWGVGENLWTKHFVQCIPADKRTTNYVHICGWQLPRRVGPGCDLGRVVFRARASQVNSSLASLPDECATKFARVHSNGRVKINKLFTRPNW